MSNCDAWGVIIMASNTMEIIQKILDHLDKSMDDERIDLTPVSRESLGISDARWSRIIGMMLEEGLVEGFAEVPMAGVAYTGYKAMDPRITLRGIQFLADNSNMAKLYRAAKEIKDWIPGL